MTLNKERGDTRIFVEGQAVAEVHRDFQGHMHDVMLYADAAPELHTTVLRSVVLYVHQYVRRLSPADITGLSHDDLVKEINAIGIGISTALYPSVEAAIDVAIQKASVPGLSYKAVNTTRGLSDSLRLELKVRKPNRFIFWKSESRPSRDYEGFHIVPAYHPVMNGWKEIGLVNGDTDYYIRGNAVGHFYCPKEAQVDGVESRGTSWSHVKHPFRAEGQDMQLEVDMTKMRSAEGVAELAQVIRASLGLDNTYVAISGGFRAPLESAHNRLVRTKRRSPYPQASSDPQRGHLARGSEDHCVWAYRTLEAEGALDKAFVPAWFKREGWLGIYEGAEVRPGIY
jgi:hypothetical protein